MEYPETDRMVLYLYLSLRTPYIERVLKSILLAKALMSIGAVKAVEIGDGMDVITSTDYK